MSRSESRKEKKSREEQRREKNRSAAPGEITPYK
jgi:hypothetical protein